jgi:hypothetical protein
MSGDIFVVMMKGTDAAAAAKLETTIINLLIRHIDPICAQPILNIIVGMINANKTNPVVLLSNPRICSQYGPAQSPESALKGTKARRQ